MHRLFIQAASFAIAVILLGGCGGSQPPARMPDAEKQNSHAVSVVPPSPPKPSYDVLHRFGRYVNRIHDRGGANPGAAGLINVGGTLYGTTAYGGVAGCNWGCGTGRAVATRQRSYF
jgi:hypothetical protein